MQSVTRLKDNGSDDKDRYYEICYYSIGLLCDYALSFPYQRNSAIIN